MLVITAVRYQGVWYQDEMEQSGFSTSVTTWKYSLAEMVVTDGTDSATYKYADEDTMKNLNDAFSKSTAIIFGEIVIMILSGITVYTLKSKGDNLSTKTLLGSHSMDEINSVRSAAKVVIVAFLALGIICAAEASMFTTSFVDAYKKDREASTPCSADEGGPCESFMGSRMVEGVGTRTWSPQTAWGLGAMMSMSSMETELNMVGGGASPGQQMHTIGMANSFPPQQQQQAYPPQQFGQQQPQFGMQQPQYAPQQQQQFGMQQPQYAQQQAPPPTYSQKQADAPPAYM